MQLPECPYDFINDFEKWFYWHKCIIFEKMTPEQVETDMRFVFGGWYRINDCPGMWGPK